MTRTMTRDTTSPNRSVVTSSEAALGLAVIRVTIGAMFVWVFFENLGKGLYTPAGYAGLVNHYVQASHSPGAWKAVMSLTASQAAIAAPIQAATEITLGVLLLVGLFTRPAAAVASLFLGSLWISELGTAWIWELLVSVMACVGVALGRAGRSWGLDAWLAKREPSSPWW
ncbi:MAG TPA: DoxX family membrane protein [Bryobacteraceae bacterium]|nr:DoxX family membrane protein [Bryobacteraceae bacterium]